MGQCAKTLFNKTVTIKYLNIKARCVFSLLQKTPTHTNVMEFLLQNHLVQFTTKISLLHCNSDNKYLDTEHTHFCSENTLDSVVDYTVVGYTLHLVGCSETAANEDIRLPQTQYKQHALH